MTHRTRLLLFASLMLSLSVLGSCLAAEHSSNVSLPPPQGPARGVQTEEADDARRSINVSDEFLQEVVAQVSQAQLMAFVEALVAFKTRCAFLPETLEAADYLFDTLSSFGLDVHFEDDVFAGHLIRNVVGSLSGVFDPQWVIVLTAHYDTTIAPWWQNSYEDAPGAMDNGTQVSMVLEAARILSQYRPSFTIEFVLFAAEEPGIIGSQMFVDRSLCEGKNILANINLDSFSYDPEGKMQAKAEVNRSSEWLLPYATRANAFTGLSMMLVTEETGIMFLQSDHYSFWTRGIPAIHLHEGTWPMAPWIHTPDDVIDHIPVPYFLEAAKLSILTATALAFDEPDQPELAIYASQEAYESGDRIDVCGGYMNPGAERELDFYLALISPDGQTFYFPSWTTQPQGTRVTLPGHACSDKLPLFALEVPSLSPPITQTGAYTFAACLIGTDGTLASDIARSVFKISGTFFCPEGMVRVPPGSYTDYFGQKHFVFLFCIDKYEYPNQPLELPIHTTNWVEAVSSCIAEGKYLCSKDEWIRACKGPDDLMFPYGAAYQAGVCNTEGLDVVTSGAYDRCVSGFGVHDMSGNVFEWTSSEQWRNLLFGGMFKSSEFRASCYSGLPPLPERGDQIPYAGFRCCLH
ncbi:MAG: M20/M25/M40 family metallo-hydrolase [Candidatus Coatesbacteria bacterium]|nr:M20/M25/M40 family metallo-hydrolase [Candidatus Coatesbacteria bacterium]